MAEEETNPWHSAASEMPAEEQWKGWRRADSEEAIRRLEGEQPQRLPGSPQMRLCILVEATISLLVLLGYTVDEAQEIAKRHTFMYR